MSADELGAIWVRWFNEPLLTGMEPERVQQLMSAINSITVMA